MPPDPNELAVYLGTYTRSEGSGPAPAGASEGIYTCRMDAATGALTVVGTTGGIENPTWLAVHPRGHALYAVTTVDGLDGPDGHVEGGLVSAYAVAPRTHELRLLGRRPSHGTRPCHCSVDATGRFLLLANYGSGSVAAYPIGPDGGLGEASHVVQHEGSGPNERRQAGPHAHSINIDPGNRFAYAADLGADRIFVYRLDLDVGRLVPARCGPALVRGGAGPRHTAFSPCGRRLYLLTEMSSELVVYDRDPDTGALEPLQAAPALPEGFEGRSSGADVRVGPAGRFLYASNRGHDSIVVHAIDPATGRLAYAEHALSGGSVPRGFSIDPTGRFVLVGNSRTGNVVTFGVDAETGRLAPTGHELAVPQCVCVAFGVPWAS